MNRKEKIEQAAWNFAPMPYNEGKDWDEVKSANLRAGFKEGHEQGYKDAIDKACEWLKYNFNMPDDFEFHFRKAMEEQQ